MTTITPATKPFEQRGKNPITDQFAVFVQRIADGSDGVALQIRLRYQLIVAPLSFAEAEQVANAILAAVRNEERPNV